MIAQNEANVWYFGFNAGIDFNSGSAVPISNGQINSNEGGSSICSPNGSLLFYSDGISAWDRNHNVMPNGSGLLGGLSSTTSALIVPRPNSCKRYFLFTVEDHQGAGSFRYSEIDLNLNAGLGDVIAGVKNVLLSQPCAEKITAIRHANGIDYWIITHALNSNNYLSYLVTAAGVNPVPVISSVGAFHASNCMIGFMKANHSGTKIVSTRSFCGPPEMANFDANTGLVSNPIAISLPASRVYGIEFSPNDSILYLCTFWGTCSLYQVNPLFPATNFLVTTTAGNYALGGLQLGPDGIIYHARTNQTFLSTINNPNVWGVGCGYTVNGFTLSPGSTSGTGIVSYPPSYLTAIIPSPSAFIFQAGCTGDSTNFFAMAGFPDDSVTWNFGDPGAGLLNLANGDTVSHIYNSAGNYAVQMVVHGCFPDTVIHNLIISDCILPVELAYLTANPVNGEIALDWETTSEINNMRFDVHRSLDGEDFEKVGEVFPLSASGDGAVYNFMDRHVKEDEIYYYRLEQFDFDGITHISNIVHSFVPSSASIRVNDVFPNPFAHEVNLNVKMSEAATLRIEITNVMGQVLGVSRSFDLEARKQKLSMNLGELAAGVYFAKLYVNGKRAGVSRLVKAR